MTRISSDPKVVAALPSHADEVTRARSAGQHGGNAPRHDEAYGGRPGAVASLPSADGAVGRLEAPMAARKAAR